MVARLNQPITVKAAVAISLPKSIGLKEGVKAWVKGPKDINGFGNIGRRLWLHIQHRSICNLDRQYMSANV